MVDFLKKIFIVPKCMRCFKPADSNNLCDRCRLELEKCKIKNPQLPINKKLSNVDGLFASYKYENAAKDVITGAKFRNPASFLASFLDDISIDIKAILEQNKIWWWQFHAINQNCTRRNLICHRRWQKEYPKLVTQNIHNVLLK